MFQRLMRSNAENNRFPGDSQKKIKEMVRNLVPSVESQVSGTAVANNSSNSPGRRRDRGRRMNRRVSLSHANKLLRIMRDRALHNSHRDIINTTVKKMTEKKRKSNEGNDNSMMSQDHTQLLKAAHLHIRRKRMGKCSTTDRPSKAISLDKMNSLKTKAVEEKKKEIVAKSIIVGNKEEEDEGEETLESKLSKLLSM